MKYIIWYFLSGAHFFSKQKQNVLFFSLSISLFIRRLNIYYMYVYGIF